MFFEIGTEYVLTYSDGVRDYFTPTERLKNGNWRGLVAHQLPGHKRRPAKQKVVFHPPSYGWQKAEGTHVRL
jgi:hypothetical protein